MRIWASYDAVRKAIKLLKTLEKYGIPEQLLRDYALNAIYTYRGVREYFFELLETEFPELLERFMKIYNEELAKAGKEGLIKEG